MQLRHLQTLAPAADGIQKISSLAWSPDNTKLAVAGADRVVHLYDEAGERRDRFRTKPADGNASGAYLVTGLAFAPDSSKLAVAQSDAVIFVYRLGSGWDEKKSICNKFAQTAPVTCIAWAASAARAGDVCFGLADGMVKLGMLRNNKTYALHSHPDGSAVLALVASPDGTSLVSGHADGSLYVFTFPEQEDGSGGPARCVKLAHHSCPPCALAWGESILAAGSDCRVAFYDPTTGRELQAFDHSGDEDTRAFHCAAVNPSGDAAVVGGFDRLHVYSRGGPKGTWQPAGSKQVENMLSVTALAWKPDGSALAVGGLRGSVDVWDTCIRRTRHRGKFELTYVSRRAVIVKTLATTSRFVLKSAYTYDISNVAVYQGRYIAGRTHATLLLGDMESCRLSEIPWEGGGGGERFYFENERACLLYSGGELHVVEYGVNEVVLSLHTAHVSPYLLSVAIQDARGALPASRRVAYLVDATTPRVVDFAAAAAAAAAGGVTGGAPVVLATVAHDARVDWLELNQRGSHLLFRDKGRRLFLLDVATQETAPLLGLCCYVQWVPGSDCVVAQSRGELCVWYGVAATDRPAIIPIKGDVIGIERAPGRTEVMVDEGLTRAAYALDEGLIDFGAALEARDFEGAIATLEALPPGPEVDVQWRALAAAALAHEDLGAAERCAAALGDVARADYLRKLRKQVEREAATASDTGNAIDGALPPPPRELPVGVRAALAALAQQWPAAESLLLAQGRVDDAIALYRDAQRWDDAIRVADTCHHPGADELRSQHFKWLLATGQEDRAGEVKERAGDLPAAVSLYLKGSVPGRAAQAIISHPGAALDPALLSAVAAALPKAGLHEKAGDLATAIGRPAAEALASYRRAHAYRKAVELARGAAPSQVVKLEEEWGDWLVAQCAHDAAVDHFVEAGVATKAIEAALAARHFLKAAGIIEHLEPAKAAPFYRRLAQQYVASGSLAEAQGFWIKAGAPMEAVDMWSKAGNWTAAQKVARAHLSEPELRRFNAQRAKDAEAAGSWAEAEQGYLAVGALEAALEMYRKRGMWDPLVRLMGQHRREALPAARLEAARALQKDGRLRDAERHYVEGGDWQAALEMHKSQGAWEDALRLARTHGGDAATRAVAYAWAVAAGPEEGALLVRRLGLGDAVVDAAVEAGAFEHAFQFATAAAPHRLPDVRLKHAMFLEDNGRFAEAETEFISAGKPREAIEMYTHCKDWDAALRVSEANDPAAIPGVLSAQARALAEAGQLTAAEAAYLRARKPEAAVDMYRAAGQWQAALRVAEAYVPARVRDLQLEMVAAAAQGGGSGGLAAIVARAQAFERANDPARAVETYLSPTGEGAAGTELDALQRCWEAALTVAARHQRHRLGDVAAAVATRLAGVRRHAAAVDVLQGVGDIQGAVETAVSAGLYDRARALAGANPQLQRAVEAAQRRALVAAGDAEALAAAGDAAGAVEIFVGRGDWERAHQMAAQAGPQLAAATAARHAEQLLSTGDAPGAAAVLAARGASAGPQLLPVFRAVAAAVLGTQQAQRAPQAEADVWAALQRLLGQIEVAPTARKEDMEEAGRMFWAAHCVSCANQARGGGLAELAARQLTAALRYAGTAIPADRAFYEAGAAWRAAGRGPMAFALLNRYLDIADAIDEAQGSGGGSPCPPEGPELAVAAGDLPQGAPLPSRHYCDEAVREEARDYVLALSMDHRVAHCLGSRRCDGCGADTFEASLACHACGAASEACAVSGYPVAAAERVVSKGGRVARRDDWNAWVGAFGTDPLTGLPATPLY